MTERNHEKVTVNQVACLTYNHSSASVPGYKFVRLAKDGLWGEWEPESQNSAYSYSPAPTSQIEKPTKPRIKLTSSDLNRNYRKITDTLGLASTDRKDLERRRLTPNQIERLGAITVDKWQEVKIPVSEHLPGISSNGNSLHIRAAGYMCPIKNPKGEVLAYQIRVRDIEEGGGHRYRWLSSTTQKNPYAPSPHQKNGELPLACHRPADGIKPDAIALCEGTGVKPFLTADMRQEIVIGAAGGQFTSSSKTLRSYLKEVSAEVTSNNIHYYPDAGDILNHSVTGRIENTLKLLESEGYRPTVGWWWQVTKGSPDIDELPEDSLIEWLEPKDFALFYQPQKEVEEKIAQCLSLTPEKVHPLALASGGSQNIHYEIYPTPDQERCNRFYVEELSSIVGWLKSAGIPHIEIDVPESSHTLPLIARGKEQDAWMVVARTYPEIYLKYCPSEMQKVLHLKVQHLLPAVQSQPDETAKPVLRKKELSQTSPEIDTKTPMKADIQIQSLLSETAQSILDGGNYRDEIETMRYFAREVYGWQNFLNQHHIIFEEDEPTYLIEQVRERLGFQEEVETLINRDRAMPSTHYMATKAGKDAELACWRVIARENFQCFEKLCPQDLRAEFQSQRPEKEERSEAPKLKQKLQANEEEVDLPTSSSVDSCPEPEEMDQGETSNSNPIPFIDIEFDPSEATVDKAQMTLNSTLANQGRWLVEEFGETKRRTHEAALQDEVRYRIVVTRSTNEMKIFASDRPEQVILIDRNRVVDHERSRATQADVDRFQLAIELVQMKWQADVEMTATLEK